MLFPTSRGGYVDFRNFNRRHWKPVQRALGINPLRDLYDLRHSYATFGLRAGVPLFVGDTPGGGLTIVARLKAAR